ncbi:uncharacterized protein LOC121737412 [Aricia agestis]|uniref:uncharacterized protein LOC121737412 n=1 Tax=Aricia agestis TaxID=91739 RepID=UPI001C20680D|nr:uncharacterized protein LOC121737412 [Aricia agestis]
MLMIYRYKMFNVSFLLIAVAALVGADFYSAKYDDFDINPLLENDRILMNYLKCFLDRGPCTAEAKDFKKAIPEALQTTCGKCTPKQKYLIRTVIKAVMEKHPKSWEELIDKYDKGRSYRDNFNKFLSEKDKYTINVIDEDFESVVNNWVVQLTDSDTDDEGQQNITLNQLMSLEPYVVVSKTEDDCELSDHNSASECSDTSSDDEYQQIQPIRTKHVKKMVTKYIFVCLIGSVVASDRYTDKYDNIDLDEILDNRRLLVAYANCILDKGKCTPEGRELKEHLQDAIENNCMKCTASQEKGATKIIDHLIKHENEIWQELIEKFDPEGKWRRKYEERAREFGIVYERRNLVFGYVIIKVSDSSINENAVMKLFVAFLLVAVALAAEDKQYTDRYDDINVEEIIQNKRLLGTYFKCVLDQGRCTPEGKVLKEHIKDALQTGCTKCTDTQKDKARIVLQYIHDHESETFDAIKKKYDPDNQFNDVFESFLNKSDHIMKTVAIFFLLIAVAVCEKYTDRYDEINVEEVLANDTLFGAYHKCITDKARCTPEGRELKEHMKEAIETECAKCTETQKKKAHIVIIHLINKKPEHWAEVCQKYDPNHTKCAKYEQKYRN